jgi:hypothetical protein
VLADYDWLFQPDVQMNAEYVCGFSNGMVHDHGPMACLIVNVLYVICILKGHMSYLF